MAEDQSDEAITEDSLGAGTPGDSVVSLADEATGVAVQMLETGMRARQPRFNEIRKNEDMYNGVVTPALKGRSNVPFDTVVMTGFIDTLMSGIDEPFSVNYHRSREQDKMAADKITAVFERESGPDKGAWNDRLLEAKFLAGLSGRGFLKLYGTNVPKFCVDLNVCDHYDMVTEPQGGSDLDKHLYKFQMNIFRTKEDMNAAADAGFYDKLQVRKLVLKYQSEDVFKKNTDNYNNKLARFAAYGVDINADSYVGQNLYRLTEGAINFKGKWYYILFSYEAKTWVRFQPLEDVFEHAKKYPGRGPWVSFATNPHPNIFWTKGPADDIRPIAYTMKKIVNLTLDNLEKRNWDMKAYDPKIFTNPADLLYKQDGIVRATLRPGQDISKGVYQFQTPDTTSITINLASWLDNYLGQKTGITADAQGASNTELVGIQVNNLQQVSKRMNLTNKRYRKMLVDLGVMFDYYLYEYLREPMAIKIIGNDGARWDEEITREDVEKEFSVTVTSELEEKEKSGPELQKKIEGFKDIEANPALLGAVNQGWYMREKLRFMGYNDEQIRVAVDKMNDGDDEILAQAAEAIQDIIEGIEFVPFNRNATTAFIRKIVNFAQDHYPLYPAAEVKKMSTAARRRYQKDMAVFDKLILYASQHAPIAEKNMQDKLVSGLAQKGALNPAPGTPAVPSATMAPSVPALNAPTQQ